MSKEGNQISTKRQKYVSLLLKKISLLLLVLIDVQRSLEQENLVFPNVVRKHGKPERN